MTKKRRKVTLDSNESTIDISKENEKAPYTSNENNTTNTSNDETCETVLGNEPTVLNDDEITIKTEIDEPMDTLNEDTEDDPNGPKMHRCSECKYKTKYAHNLRTHKTKHLSGDDVYMRCEFCASYKTKWESTYLSHMKNKHGINIQDVLKCSLCQFKTKVKVCLTRHCDREHKGKEAVVKKSKCEHPGCSYETNSDALLSVHSLIHKNSDMNEIGQTAKKAFSCTECHFETNSKRHIVTHMKSAHSSGDTTTAALNLTEKYTTNVQIVKKSKTVPKFKCSRCPYRTHTQISLEKHLVKHQFSQQSHPKQTNTKTSKCPNCPFTSPLSYVLDDHQKTRCKANTLFCKECPFRSKVKSDYIKHILTHRNTTIEMVKSHKTDQSDGSLSKVREFDTVLIKEEPHYDD
ncbi:zinc finger Y-chromosomal protein 2 isoform X2 [Leptinotarsa decemlineata]|nr:zinc finger protein ZFAT-like isoform X2 [Leptinotarsa decemlineata]